jgi:hypothetical protein
MSGHTIMTCGGALWSPRQLLGARAGQYYLAARSKSIGDVLGVWKPPCTALAANQAGAVADYAVISARATGHAFAYGHCTAPHVRACDLVQWLT